MTSSHEKAIPFKPFFRDEIRQEVSKSAFHSQEELESIYEKGFREGLESGKAELKEGIENDLLLILKRLKEDLPLLVKQAQEKQIRLNQQTIEIFMSVFKKVLPSLLEKSDHTVKIETLLRESISYLNAAPQLVFKLSPQENPSLKERLLSFFQEKENAPLPLFEEDPACLPGSCTLSWDTGALIRSPAHLVGKIEEYFNDFLTSLTEEDDITPSQLATEN